MSLKLYLTTDAALDNKGSCRCLAWTVGKPAIDEEGRWHVKGDWCSYFSPGQLPPFLPEELAALGFPPPGKMRVIEVGEYEIEEPPIVAEIRSLGSAIDCVASEEIDEKLVACQTTEDVTALEKHWAVVLEIQEGGYGYLAKVPHPEPMTGEEFKEWSENMRRVSDESN